MKTAGAEKPRSGYFQDRMKILFIENHARFAEVVTRHFLSEHSVTTVASIARAQEALVSEAFDLILLDYDLDDGKGTELIPHVFTLASRPPSIAVSSHAEGNAALQQAGADGVCRKADFARIGTTISDLLHRKQAV
jgi:CheY-like chemotaxis protein